MDENLVCIQIPALIADARRALTANAQFSALCISLALADECASIEWEKAKGHKPEVREREAAYAAWYDMWRGTDDRVLKNLRRTNNGTLPRLDGKLLYKVRCALLHAMSLNIEFADCGLPDDANRNIRDFTPMLSAPTEWGIGGEASSCCKEKHNTLHIDIAGLASELLYFVELYYKRNEKNLFNSVLAYDSTGEYDNKVNEAKDQ